MTAHGTYGLFPPCSSPYTIPPCSVCHGIIRPHAVLYLILPHRACPIPLFLIPIWYRLAGTMQASIARVGPVITAHALPRHAAPAALLLRAGRRTEFPACRRTALHQPATAVPTDPHSGRRTGHTPVRTLSGWPRVSGSTHRGRCPAAAHGPSAAAAHGYDAAAFFRCRVRRSLWPPCTRQSPCSRWPRIQRPPCIRQQPPIWRQTRIRQQPGIHQQPRIWR